ncbi:MAG: DNA cytosine methyltransferase [Candidatus Zixiibacteriota bacterium]
MESIRAIDLFCGGGGSSWGAQNAGVRIAAGFDSWEVAGKIYQDNFPRTKFFLGRVEDHKPSPLKRRLGRIDLILASPECTNHSPAKGKAPRCELSRATAFQVVRYAEAFQPRWILIENVVSMRNWTRYGELIACLIELGYSCSEHILDSADFGVPQSRRRLFVVCDRDADPSVGPPASSSSPRTVADILCPNGEYAFTQLRSPNRAQATIERALRALEVIGPQEPFLIVYYGSDHAGGWQPISKPLRTITTLDRFAYVRPHEGGHIMRMLQPEELKLAMGWPKRFRIMHGTRRERIKIIGNAVCPPVMQAVVSALVRKVSS